MKTIRKILSEIIDASAPERVAAAVSGGVDSWSVALSARDTGRTVTAYSFTFRDHQSSDFIQAKAIAAHFGIEFVPVHLPEDPEEIYKQASHLIIKYRLMKKARVECAFPFHTLADTAEGRGETCLITGLLADGHFGLSKKAMIHFRYPTEALDTFRQEYFSDPDATGKSVIRSILAERGMSMIAPYGEPQVFKEFIGKPWDDLNKPRQKEAIRKHYPELDPLRIARHSNLQLGDSLIAERIGSAVMSKVPGTASPIAAYNRIRRQGC